MWGMIALWIGMNNTLCLNLKETRLKIWWILLSQRSMIQKFLMKHFTRQLKNSSVGQSQGSCWTRWHVQFNAFYVFTKGRKQFHSCLRYHSTDSKVDVLHQSDDIHGVDEERELWATFGQRLGWTTSICERFDSKSIWISQWNDALGSQDCRGCKCTPISCMAWEQWIQVTVNPWQMSGFGAIAEYVSKLVMRYKVEVQTWNHNGTDRIKRHWLGIIWFHQWLVKIVRELQIHKYVTLRKEESAPWSILGQ